MNVKPPTFVFAPILLISGVGLLFLAFGPTGNNRYCYLFQMAVWPRGIESSVLKTRTTWWSLTQRASVESYNEGVPDGRWVSWWGEGTVMYDGVYRDGQPWSGTLPLFEAKAEVGGSSPHIIVSFKDGQPVSAAHSDGVAFDGFTRAIAVAPNSSPTRSWSPSVELYEFVEGQFVEPLSEVEEEGVRLNSSGGG